ncbi:hypothetical protein CH253_08375 [Rhodococcus sp. 06-156-3C]|uniref:hypothetical protein n=1 Tax=Rhodococcus sp. 06-156-3C TaxID=2022486 RepID=UPI000B9A3380|nr:hypothetical protein [Rhodococcus sp. 06-156-3C]OZD23862.1 hypothetical protein CH253_08375 [Rhodococcus sp. 06-156-3C]
MSVNEAFNTVAQLFRAEGERPVGDRLVEPFRATATERRIRQLQAGIKDRELKAKHEALIAEAGGTDVARAGWDAVKAFKPGLDGVGSFDDLPIAKAVEYVVFGAAARSFEPAVEAAVTAAEPVADPYAFKVGDKVRVTGPAEFRVLGRTEASTYFKVGDVATVTFDVLDEGDLKAHKDGDAPEDGHWIAVTSLTLIEADPVEFATFDDVPADVLKVKPKATPGDRRPIEFVREGDGFRGYFLDTFPPAPNYRLLKGGDYSFYAPFVAVQEDSTPEAEPEAYVFKAGDRAKITGPVRTVGGGACHLAASQIVDVVEAGMVAGNIKVRGQVTPLSFGDVFKGTQWIDPASLTLVTEPRVFESGADVPEGVTVTDRGGSGITYTRKGNQFDCSACSTHSLNFPSAPLTEVLPEPTPEPVKPAGPRVWRNWGDIPQGTNITDATGEMWVRVTSTFDAPGPFTEVVGGGK